ncbi:hypothetical protein Tco_0284900 [Tanacetum coccineum]
MMVSLEAAAASSVAAPIKSRKKAVVAKMKEIPLEVEKRWKAVNIQQDYQDYFNSQQLNAMNQEAGTKQMKSS